MAFDHTENISNEEAHAVIRLSLSNGTLTLSRHARERMKERGYSTHDIEHIILILFGSITKKEFWNSTSSWRYTLEGSDLSGENGGMVVTITKHKSSVVITVLS